MRALYRDGIAVVVNETVCAKLIASGGWNEDPLPGSAAPRWLNDEEALALLGDVAKPQRGRPGKKKDVG